MYLRYITPLLAIVFLNCAYANNISLAKFFSSNNTNIIDVSAAYERLIGEPQDSLKNSIIDVIQQNHLEQNKCEDVLGMYQMVDGQNITADNTKVFMTSPYQTLSEQVVFDIAKQLANALKQESIGVFIPESETGVGDIEVNFSAHSSSIADVVGIIRSKLPPHYSQAYSIHLKQKNAGYEQTKVSSVEWLGSQIKAEEIKKAFPTETVSTLHGKAYLIYKNGQRQEL